MADEVPFSGPPPGPSSTQVPKKKNQDEQFLGLSRDISELLSRLRLLEERYANLRREHQTTSQNMIENHQNLSRILRKHNENILGVRRELSELREQLGVMQGELADSAKDHEFKVLQHYVDLWNPMSFLTRQEALNMLDEAARKVYKEQERLSNNGSSGSADISGQVHERARPGQ